MKDTLRTASITETYEEADKALSEQRADLHSKLVQIKKQREKNTLDHIRRSSGRVVGIIIGIVVGIIVIMFVCLAIAAIVARSNDATPIAIGFAIGVILSLVVLFKGLTRMSFNPYTKADLSYLNAEEKALGLKMAKLDEEQTQLAAKKRALLLGEVSITNRDLNIVKKEELQEAPIETMDSKTCPACAEEVKKAAKVCRFCQHQFVEKP